MPDDEQNITVVFTEENTESEKKKNKTIRSEFCKNRGDIGIHIESRPSNLLCQPQLLLSPTVLFEDWLLTPLRLEVVDSLNCPRDRSKMEYVSEMSEPRYRKLVFYCHHYRAFRMTYEPEREKVFTMLLDGVNLKMYLLPT